MTIFNHGAAIVPGIITVAEEQHILLRISQAPWLTDLGRRVQHRGFGTTIAGPAMAATTRRPVPALGHGDCRSAVAPFGGGWPEPWLVDA